MTTTLKTSALALMIAGGLAAAPALAQQTQGQQPQQQTQQSQGQPKQRPAQQAQGEQHQKTQQQAQGQQAQPNQQAGTQPQQGQGAPMAQAQGQMPGAMPMDQGQQAQQQAESQALIATVGDREIRGEDVLRVIGELPPRLRNAPVEMLVPVALDQLVTRELILQRAEQAGLRTDPAVQKLIGPEAQEATERAMIQVWLDRQLSDRVTDQRVSEVYEQAAQAAGDGAQVPPLEQVRPMIEQQLRMQALRNIQASLTEDADVTFYGPTGQPLDANAFTSSQ